MANTENTLPYLPQEMWEKIMYFKDVSEHNDLTKMLVKEIKTERAKDTEEDWENCKCFKRINGVIARKPWFELTQAYNEFYEEGSEYKNFYEATLSRAYETYERMYGNVLQDYEDSEGWTYCASGQQIDII